jgi:hypothetical protein
MEPNQNPNIQPIPPAGVEQPSLESQPQVPVAPEAAPSNSQSAPSSPAPSNPSVSGLVAPGAPISPQPGATQPAAHSSAPLPPADDVDVIEKEWVDQAEHIIDQTKNDPYTEEEAVEALQTDYLKKRYGHDVKKPKIQ